ADLVQEVHAFVQERTFFQARNGIHGLLLPQPPGDPALVTPGEPPIQSFHQIRCDFFCVLHGWPSFWSSSSIGRPTPHQADSLCWNFRSLFTDFSCEKKMRHSPLEAGLFSSE